MSKRAGVSCVAVLVVSAIAILGPELAWWLADLVAERAATSPRSRWYELEELGIADIEHEIERAISVGSSGISGECVDLRDLQFGNPVVGMEEHVVLQNTEAWEAGIESGRDSVGYPSLVKNDHGESADGKYYLYYAIHDPYSGIGVAIAGGPSGPFAKLANLSWWRPDSRVLRAPRRPRETSHFSSPVVVWNPAESVWFMYFHYYANEWERGRGHQRTALATSKSLGSHDWEPWRDADGALIAVLPTTRDRWMNSQSTYHSIQRLPTGLWVAFLRGVGGDYAADGTWRQDVAKLGFAVSRDGRRWAQIPSNPVLQAGDPLGGKSGVYRPVFVALAPTGLLLAWSESDYYDSSPIVRFGLTRDLEHVVPLSLRLPGLRTSDGAASLRREEDTLYVAQGDHVDVYSLRATPAPDGDSRERTR